ncbi:ligand-gated channel [Klebsiella pneumoniae]|uniref:TonB-dependent receptor domain-containing protein n=1 Tax=Klebsiella pneumoniae TaxID=573 RepID=UPI001C80E229|nr:TonB-dependent receptor [Klebsiella pneumoniae]MBX4604978.1 ligand-gated channel [Klebsiella pneumoniae]
MHVIKVVIGILVIPPLAIQAATAHPSSPDKDTITVVATGNQNTVFETPAMVSVVTRETPWSQNAVTSAGMMKGVAGLGQTGAGRTNGQTFNLRGYDKSGVLVLVDGVRQLSDMAKSSGTWLDPALVKRVEVVRGPNSSLYGSGGLGGVVDFRTADATDFLVPGELSGFRLWGNTASGDHSTGSGLTWFGKTENTDELLSVIMRKRGSLYQSDGGHAPNEERPASVFAKGSVRLTDASKVGASLRLYRNVTTEPGNPTLTRGDSGLRDRKTVQNDVQLWHQYAPADRSLINLKSTIYLSDTTIKTEGESKTAEWRNNRTSGVNIVNRSHTLTFPGAHQLSYGAEYYRQQQSPEGSATLYPEGEINFSSLYFQDEMTMEDYPVNVIVGTRYDRYRSHNPRAEDLKAGRWSPRAAISVSPTDWLMMYGAVSSAFRAPTMAEMYRDDVHFYRRGKPNYWIPNPDLKPENNITREVGVGFQMDSLFTANDHFQVKGGYFGTDARNYIATRVDMKRMRSYSYNVSWARIWGWDVQGNYQSDYADWTLSYNRTESMDADSREWLGTGNPDTLISNISLPVGHEGIYAGWRAELSAAVSHVKKGDSHQAGYAIHSFSLSYKPAMVKGFEASVTLDNAFNKLAMNGKGVPLSGRSISLYTSYQW